jgi:hypothetical protein
MTGEGPSYRERQCQRVECPKCAQEMSQGALKMHRQCTHSVEDMEAAPAAALQPPVNYYVSFPKTIRSKPCPVLACLGRACSTAGLWAHFQRLRPTDTICILEEGNNPLTRCANCDMHVP